MHGCSSPPIMTFIGRSAGNDGRTKGASAGGRTGGVRHLAPRQSASGTRT
ncbi:hypothetical protein EBBID32_21840 [Sphingobium indicum BiD32]|uniref:Uncharacterized protein n=1 Tax=Sphingobium indicum BiD32 TaxID=1301087 RepID=N1MKS5_9SPHN|nr:hypothetical protein EBBID32_21840 [Sphingobium indicum BiD32]